MDSFSTIALKKMHERANDYSKKVGRVLYESNPTKYKDYTWTDCSTFSTNVLSDTYIELGQTSIAKKVRALATNGNDLAHYLVTEQSWVAIFVSSDVYHPHDGNHGHGMRYYRADTKCVYGKVPISYFAINFRPTPSPRRAGPLPKNFLAKSVFAKSTAWSLRSHKLIETKQNLIDLNELKKMKFGLGVSRIDSHVWLYSNGSIYEAHWDKEGKDIFESTPLMVWPWVDNIIVIPPDLKMTISSSKIRKCTL